MAVDLMDAERFRDGVGVVGADSGGGNGGGGGTDCCSSVGDFAI